MKPRDWVRSHWSPDPIVLAKFYFIGFMVLAFAAGFFMGRPGHEMVMVDQAHLRTLEEERDHLKARNRDLEITLGLVKRQIQTDRIAYGNLQRTVEASEQERMRIQKQVEVLREILEHLRNRLKASRDHD